MEAFSKEIEIGDIHLLDRWQFELKSEFYPALERGVSSCTQEFYFFIPNVLEVNEDTYSKSQFYQDQTNFIRYKTPEFTLVELTDLNNLKSPLTRLYRMKDFKQTKENIEIIMDELKLLGNVVRSSLRERVRKIFFLADSSQKSVDRMEIESFCKEILAFRKSQNDLMEYFINKWKSPEIHSHLIYLDEFISNSIDYYLTASLERLSKESMFISDENISNDIYFVLEKERRHREEFLHVPPVHAKDSVRNESIIYRRRLLNRFVMDALLLPVTRASLDKRFSNIISCISAGIAMLVFLLLFIWQGKVLLINSIPFIIATVVLYILKDRLKEGLKAISYRQFYKWFSDYTTDILSPDGKSVLGKLSESFSFVQESELPAEIVKIRNREFHSVLETFKRPEHVIYYKRIIKLYPAPKLVSSRRNALNLIFKFNINNFLRKADNPSIDYVTIDYNHRQLVKMKLPKVYHINVIIKSTYNLSESTPKVELKKFRLVIDKSGIKRIEFVDHKREH